MNRIVFDHVSKHYGDVLAVDDLSLTIEPGTTVALLGANGAGKSTSINLLLGLLTPARGTIAVRGRTRPRRSATARWAPCSSTAPSSRLRNSAFATRWLYNWRKDTEYTVGQRSDRLRSPMPNLLSASSMTSPRSASRPRRQSRRNSAMDTGSLAAMNWASASSVASSSTSSSRPPGRWIAIQVAIAVCAGSTCRARRSR
ncbi:ATP-binding cassette domain-containing protein [Nonomuraea sp. NPDC050643]|uniref:ATP-binding cassette domain-containing protein n=1 Tax=Nonomuraea sp. NPDC050643 TaxID=3155660 RepID=UPI0033F26FC7